MKPVLYIGEGGAVRPARRHPKPTHWRHISGRALARDRRCRCCGVTHDLEVHHLTYARFGAEWLEDLTVLCSDCHDAITAFINVKRRLSRQLQLRWEMEQAGQQSLLPEAKGQS